VSSKPEVTLTFAGDATALDRSFASVGASSRSMETDVGRASRSVRDYEDSTDRAASANSQLSGGIGDIGGALTATFGDNSAIGAFGAQMETAGMVVMGFTGVMDLANLATRAQGLSAIWAATQAKVAAGGARVWAAAQWVLNGAFLASPITWIVLGIIALIAVIVLIATKTTWFQTAWKVAWGGIKKAASAVWDWISALPGKFKTVFEKVGRFITAPFRAAFNFVADAWNNTVGSLSFSIPSWVPVIGGNGFSVPDMPKFHGGSASVGGGMPGEFLAVLRSGERVSPTAGGGGGGGVMTLRASGSGTSVERALAEVVAGLINRNVLQLSVSSGSRVVASSA
jgi:hypothetical protein